MTYSKLGVLSMSHILSGTLGSEAVQRGRRTCLSTPTVRDKFVQYRPSSVCTGRSHRRANITCVQSSSRASSPDVSSHSNGNASIDEMGSFSDSFGESFSEDGLSFEEDFIVRSYEIDPSAYATPSTIAYYLQEVASNHCFGIWGDVQCNVDSDPMCMETQMPNQGSTGLDPGYTMPTRFAIPQEMVQNSLAWVCSKLRIKMETYPQWSQRVRVETWVLVNGRISVNREWTIRDAQTGQYLGGAASEWVCLNVEKRRISRIPPGIFEAKVENFHIGKAVGEDMRGIKYGRQVVARRLPEVDTATAACNQIQTEEGFSAVPVVNRRLPEISDSTNSTHLTVRRQELDVNNHVNNVSYLTWALESLPVDDIADMEVQEIELHFLQEAKYGDVVESTVSELAPEGTEERHVATEETEDLPKAEQSNGSSGGQRAYAHKLTRIGDESELIMRAKSIWRHRAPPY